MVRKGDRLGFKVNKKEVVEGVTITQTPPMVVVGVVGYMRLQEPPSSEDSLFGLSISVRSDRGDSTRTGLSPRRRLYLSPAPSGLMTLAR